MERTIHSSGAPWEALAGYSRAVRTGPFVAVAGTVAAGEDGQIVAEGDAYGQTVFILKKIERALKDAGAEMRHVTRTRMFVTRIEDWEQITRAHGEFFSDIRPAATLVAIAGLIDSRALVEIEADAIIHDAT